MPTPPGPDAVPDPIDSTDPNLTDPDVLTEPSTSSSGSLPSGVTMTFSSSAAADETEAGVGISPSDAPTVGTATASRYQVAGEIARGGMGVVFKAWDSHLNREVALKMLHEGHRGKPSLVRRFLEEARITGRLQHPCIVPIHELGESADRRPFFVMSLVRGQTLDQILNDRPSLASDLPRFLKIFEQVCQAVAYAHAHGVIHRDLKPANVMIGGFGVVKVMDWGLAKMLGEADLPDAMAAASAAAELSHRCEDEKNLTPADEQGLFATQVGVVFGTPAYLPPEQARGEIDRIDERADVFGLGGILCEILTGRPPYVGVGGREVYHKAVDARLSDAFTRLDACAAEREVVALAKRCLSGEPGDRPWNAGEVARAMTEYLESDLRRAERDQARFFDLTLDLFCIAGVDGYFRRVNSNFSRILGYTTAELLSTPFIEFIHPEDRNRTQAEVAKISSGELCVRFLNRYRHTSGDYRWFEWTAKPIPAEGLIYAVARDVTDRSQDCTTPS